MTLFQSKFYQDELPFLASIFNQSSLSSLLPQTVHQCVVSAADTCRREEVLDPPPGYRTDSDTVWVRSGV